MMRKSQTALTKSITKKMKPLGVIGYTACCRSCTYSYSTDDDFEIVDDGIDFICLYLRGEDETKRFRVANITFGAMHRIVDKNDNNTFIEVFRVVKDGKGA